MKDGDKIIQLARQKQRLNRLMPEVKTPILGYFDDSTHNADPNLENCLVERNEFYDWKFLYRESKFTTHNN